MDFKIVPESNVYVCLYRTETVDGKFPVTVSTCSDGDIFSKSVLFPCVSLARAFIDGFNESAAEEYLNELSENGEID